MYSTISLVIQYFEDITLCYSLFFEPRHLVPNIESEKKNKVSVIQKINRFGKIYKKAYKNSDK